MSNNNNSSSGGIGLCGVVFVVFLILKLCGIISWSWWWVLAPLWMPVALIAIFLLITWIAVVIATFMDR